MTSRGGAGSTGRLDERVVEALGRVHSPDDLAADLLREGDVVEARVVPGVVKTNPPVVELLVEQRQDDGSVSRRVYDLVSEPDGRLRMRGQHP